MAFGVMDAARDEFGLRIPHDLKVCGFDNSSLASWSSYDLTSVDQDIAAMVERHRPHPRRMPSARALARRGADRHRSIIAGEGPA